MQGYLLSGFLAIQSGPVFDNPEKEAVRHLGKALVYELELDKVGKRIEKRHVPKKLKEYAPYIGIVVRIGTERRISYTWEF